MLAYKRVAVGSEVVEWNETEGVWRRYEATGTSLPLSQWVTTKLIQRWAASGQARERLESMWVAQGQVVVNR